ncbi:hypothetical protein K0B96_15265 [Horticoccus luteus]|uniref:Thioredoxin domain-containing protein n=1 Tax=Horticoccus luteus TaxID=2862869 RepID=A0A8F9TUQ6_9BACT|nr:hypothetical protein [Horticoccus luteus]QYM78643.1 hypothetical protein K0B96_15265 [Horticoccus luteus]
MKTLLLMLGSLLMVTGARSAPGHAGWLDVEEQVAAIAAGPQVTVVHFWAPWCPNSRAELAKDGWSTFVASNLDVKFVFVTMWSAEDGKKLLADSGVVDRGNLTVVSHPQASRKAGERAEVFMDLPVTWLPTTWVMRDGKLCYAFNYGEVRWPMLQQAVRDAAETWER